MKKLSLLFAIALIIPVSTYCSQGGDGQRLTTGGLIVGVATVVLIGYGALKYWTSDSPTSSPSSFAKASDSAKATSDASTDTTADTANPQQNNQGKIIPPVPAIPLNKLIPVPGISDEDHKAVENALNASKKPTDTNAKPTPIICPPTKTEQPKPTLQATISQKTQGFSLGDACEKINNRSCPKNIDHPTNDYLDIISGY
jgi:hypothetical protein